MADGHIVLKKLTRGQVRNLAGHDRGTSARAFFEIDRLDQVPEPVIVDVPENFRAISASFFQGMFSESVRALGGALAFFEHYRFDAPAHIRTKLAEYAEQSQRTH
ncbi:hypothetical protein [Pelagerythrobacter sp.]|uniref:hypothetical protein n=1 Tax=Pelagerythrobacter sp. TaxID=2800702 RepID=UPI0035B36BFE